MSPARILRILAALLLALPAAAQAQRASEGWEPVRAGLRVGFDNNANATVAGAQLRIPVVPAGWLELVPSGDVTFLTGLKEYQFNADAVVLLGGASGGVYGGGGLAVRNSIFGDGDGVGTTAERETRTGANLLLGLATKGSLAEVPLGIQIEARWVFLDAPFDPQLYTFGVNLPLWGWGRDR